jgi:hypothetical protein
MWVTAHTHVRVDLRMHTCVNSRSTAQHVWKAAAPPSWSRSHTDSTSARYTSCNAKRTQIGYMDGQQALRAGWALWVVQLGALLRWEPSRLRAEYAAAPPTPLKLVARAASRQASKRASYLACCKAPTRSCSSSYGRSGAKVRSIATMQAEAYN